MSPPPPTHTHTRTHAHHSMSACREQCRLHGYTCSPPGHSPCATPGLAPYPCATPGLAPYPCTGVWAWGACKHHTPRLAACTEPLSMPKPQRTHTPPLLHGESNEGHPWHVAPHLALNPSPPPSPSLRHVLNPTSRLKPRPPPTHAAHLAHHHALNPSPTPAHCPATCTKP